MFWQTEISRGHQKAKEVSLIFQELSKRGTYPLPSEAKE